MEEASHVIGLVLPQSHLFVLHTMMAVSPLHREIEGLPLRRHGKAYRRRQPELELGGEEVPNVGLTIRHRSRPCPSNAYEWPVRLQERQARDFISLVSRLQLEAVLAQADAVVCTYRQPP